MINTLTVPTTTDSTNNQVTLLQQTIPVGQRVIYNVIISGWDSNYKTIYQRAVVVLYNSGAGVVFSDGSPSLVDNIIDPAMAGASIAYSASGSNFNIIVTGPTSNLVTIWGSMIQWASF